MKDGVNTEAPNTTKASMMMLSYAPSASHINMHSHLAHLAHSEYRYLAEDIFSHPDDDLALYKGYEALLCPMMAEALQASRNQFMYVRTHVYECIHMAVHGCVNVRMCN